MSSEEFDRIKHKMYQEIQNDIDPEFPHQYRTVEEIRANIFDGARHVPAYGIKVPKPGGLPAPEPKERRERHGLTIV